MNDIKSKLLKEIEAKANKIKERRISAANNKSIEDACFDFFKNIEESRSLHQGSMYDRHLFHEALRALRDRVNGFDYGTKVTIEFQSTDIPEISWHENYVRGVTIWWSKAYIAKNNVDPSIYIDVSSMLFF